MGTEYSFEIDFVYGGKSFGMLLPSREDHISKKIVTDKTFYECAYLEALAALLDEGDCVLDVGANIGNHTVYFAGVVGCQVHSFEPIPSTFAILEENIRRNGLGSRVQAHMLALGDGEGHAEVAAFDPGNLGGTTLRLEDHGEITVSCIDHLDLQGPIRLIKVDAEGMDVSVLAGAEKLIERERPILACEAATSADYVRLQALLDVHGYVSVACYNATETYIFLPARSPEEIKALTRYGFSEIISLQRNAMAVQARFAQAGRYAERVAKEQGEKAGAQVVALQARIDEVIEHALKGQISVEQKMEELISQLKRQEDERSKKQEELISQLKRQEDERSKKQHEIDEIKRKLLASDENSTVLNKKLRDAEKFRDAAEHDIALLRTKLSGEVQARRTLEQAIEKALASGNQQRMELGRSITFQVGSSFVSAMNSMQGLVKLPVRLARIRREMKRRQELSLGAADWNLVVPVQLPKSVHSPLAIPTETAQTSPVTGDLQGTVPVDVPALPSMPANAEDVRMAVIMDEFTHASYAPCCQLERLHPETGLRQLEALSPHVMFVESAWRGENGEWERKVRHGDPHLLALVQWCRQRRVPTAFWNKEDPVHFETFISTARLFDYVFTTDIDCIARYKSLLGHDRVYLLPFACQPESHNPIEKYERKGAACFAGAYYVRYPDRQRDFDAIIQSLQESGEVDIYDRNFGKDDVNYMFPESYAPLIKGGLAFEDIDVAYKGYRYGINLNSVKQSQTMFARRVFDLLACNTVTISNFSRGLRLLLGDLVISTDSGSELKRRLMPYRGDENASNYRKFRLLGLRKVLSEHTYADRLAYIMSKMAGTSSGKRMPEIRVVSKVCTREQAERVIRVFRRQSYENKHLYLLASEDNVQAVSGIRGDDISLLSWTQAEELIPSGEWYGCHLAVFSSRDYYGPAYLTDLALATLYSDEAIIGKDCHYQGQVGAVPALRNDGGQYKHCEAIAPRRSLTIASVIQTDLAKWCQSEDVNLSVALSGLAIDEFNYVADADLDACAEADDLVGVNLGLPLQQVLEAAEAIEAQHLEPEEGARVLSRTELLGCFQHKSNTGKVAVREMAGELILESQLIEGEHAYIYARDPIPLEGWAVNGEVNFYLDAELGLFIQPTLIFLDAQGVRVGSSIKYVCRNTSVHVPEHAVAVRLGLRVAGPGRCRVNRWVLGDMPIASSVQLSKSEVLLVTNVYPSYEALYRNGFVHRRLKGYEAKGLSADVFCLRNLPDRNHSEYENINVTTGWKDALRDQLSSNRYQTILVHFLDADMWEVLRDYVGKIRVLVWVHGSEIQHWKQREFNYKSEIERQAAVVASDKRMELWRAVLGLRHPNMHFVFVSEWFKDSATEDVGVVLKPWQYSIIHNVIDSDLFAYENKNIAQRWNFLSIRPYASMKYANDLTVRAILSLRNEPEFEQMNFRLIGDGPMFDDVLAPVMDFPNVHVEKRFLSQSEIASIHKEYGVFITPTRMDSQGVSRDEAMASGLVAITNAVAAIPEFVDESCGILVPPEDAEAMARQMLYLVRDPARFQALSQAAADRVRAQSGYVQTIGAEYELIKGTSAHSM